MQFKKDLMVQFFYFEDRYIYLFGKSKESAACLLYCNYVGAAVINLFTTGLGCS